MLRHFFQIPTKGTISTVENIPEVLLGTILVATTHFLKKEVLAFMELLFLSGADKCNQQTNNQLAIFMI